MGGYGSGRSGWHGKVEVNRSLDINMMNRKGCLKPGWTGNWQWTRDGERVAWINLRVEASALHLTYRFRAGGGEWEDISETVQLTRTPCRYGGTRPWFLCPGIVNGRHCGRRVAKLYGAGRYFLCRHCFQLAYTSQSETDWDRALRAANKRRVQLGGEPGMVSPLPDRPKGMWRRTYERELAKVVEADERANCQFVTHCAPLLGKWQSTGLK